MKNFLYIFGASLATLGTCTAAPADTAEVLEARKKSFDCNDKLVVVAFSKYPSLASSLCSSYVSATTTTVVLVSFVPDPGAPHQHSRLELPKPQSLIPCSYRRRTSGVYKHTHAANTNHDDRTADGYDVSFGSCPEDRSRFATFTCADIVRLVLRLSR